MSPMAARFETDAQERPRSPPTEGFLPLQLAACAAATGGLIEHGLATRAADAPLTDETGALRPEIAPLARAYEAALLAGLSPTEVKTLRWLLARVEAAALKLSGRA